MKKLISALVCALLFSTAFASGPTAKKSQELLAVVMTDTGHGGGGSTDSTPSDVHIYTDP